MNTFTDRQKHADSKNYVGQSVRLSTAQKYSQERPLRVDQLNSEIFKSRANCSRRILARLNPRTLILAES